MGKIIKNKKNGMSWWARTGLVLLLTFVSTIFATVSATAATYHVRGISSVSVGTNGSTNLVAENGISTDNTSGGTNEYRAITNTTAPTGTSRNRIRFNATTTVTGDERFRAYTPVYSSATTIAAGATAHLTAYMRTTGTSARIYAVMYEYNDTTGFVGALKGTTNTATLLQTTQNSQQFDVTFTNTAFTVASGNRIAVVFYATTSNSDAAYLYGAVYNSGTPAGTTYFTLTESTAAATSGTLAVSAAAQTVAESAGNATVSVTRTGGTTGSVTVDYATANGTGLAGQDFTSATGTLTWAAGDATAKTITVPITNDTYDEGNETFTVTLSNATNGASLGTAVQTITITDDDGTPTIGFSAATSSGSKNTTPAAITVVLSAASGLATSVNYTTVNGTASAGTDYTTTSGTLTIPALSTTGTINVPILATGTGGKSFTITLSTPTNSTLGTTTHTFTITATAATGITTCGGCHGHPAGPNLMVDANRAASAGTFQGSHTKHVSVAADCAKCHTNPTRMDHSSGAIEVAISAGGTYSKASPIAISTSPTLTGGTCSSTTCHGSSSPTWGTSTTNAACTKCHGVSGTSSVQFTADTKTAAPGYVSTAPAGTGRSTSGATAATDTTVGAHDTHLRGLNTISNPVACTECHANVNTANASFTGHMDGAGSLNFGTLATSGTGTAPTYNATNNTCSNTYCHYGRTAYAAPATANGAVVWNNTAYLTGVDTAAADCGRCHASPPSLTGTHAATPALTIADCTGCHSHVNANGTFNNAALHINGIVEASGDCISCHASVVNSPVAAALNAAVATRPAIVPSFSLASKHTRSRGTAVTNNDCCVCHMEGDVATGSPNGTYHKNGYIELRDPDTGLTIKGVSHSGTTTAAGAYTSTGADARPVRFSRNLGSATIEADTAAIMISQCLKCHDADGALSTSAQVAGGSALKPFAGTITANPSGGVLNVAAQFASTNKSFHPVLVRQNSGYTNTGGTRMVTPWNAVAKTATTTTYGPLISCWDCHAPNGSTSATILTTSGIHGGAVNGTDAVPLRGNVYVNGTTAATNLCIACHVASGGTTNHGAGSAITSNTNSGMTYFQNRCYFCHGSYGTRAAVTRPMGAGDAHGYNTRATGAAFPAVNNGYAFLRNEGWYANAYTQSIKSIGATTYTPTCGGVGAGGGCSRGSMGGYTPGGVY